MDINFQNKMLNFIESMENRLTALEFSSKSPSSTRGKDSYATDRHPVAKAMCSGRDKTAHDVVHNNAWPHFYVTSTENRPAKYLPGIQYLRTREGYLPVPPTPLESHSDSGQEWDDSWTHP